MTVIINGTDNAVGNPAIQGGTGGTSAGLYYPAANTVAITTSGVNALTISSTQNATFANNVTITGTTTQTGNASFSNITATGSVGIGTASPSYKLEVQGSANTYLGQRIYNTSSGSSAVSYLQIGNDTNGATAQLGLNSSTNTANFGGANALYLANGLSAPIAFATAGAETMRLTSGVLLVGRTSVYSDVSVGAPAIQTQSTNGVRSGLACIADTTGTLNVTGYVNPNGYVGGVFTSGSSTIYNTSSDYRLKENITPIANALESVAKLKPVDYTWKVDSTKGQGFIAHELQEVCPQAVTGTKDDVDADGKPKYQGVDTSFLVAMLTKAIQELKAELDEANTKIAVLQEKLGG